MRIWHESLIPKLCRQHLLAMWREGLGCYKIVTGEVNGGSYRNHPAVKEFINHLDLLYDRLEKTRIEMLNRGYHPKELPETSDKFYPIGNFSYATYQPWQTLEQQIEVLQSKHCACKL